MSAVARSSAGTRSAMAATIVTTGRSAGRKVEVRDRSGAFALEAVVQIFVPAAGDPPIRSLIAKTHVQGRHQAPLGQSESFDSMSPEARDGFVSDHAARCLVVRCT